MASVLIHIGQSKTGTTSIQRNLHSHRSDLLLSGILYPETSRFRYNHHSITPMFVERERIDRAIMNGMGYTSDSAIRLSRESWAGIVQQARAPGVEQVILSSEALYHDFLADEGERFRSMLHEISTDVRVIGYVRSPSARFMSQVQQQLKTHRQIRQMAPAILALPPQRLTEIFGRPCELRVFDRSILKDGDIVADFLDWSGIAATARVTDIGAWKIRDWNVSESAESMSVLSRLGADRRPSTKWAHKRQKALVAAVQAADAALPSPTRPRLNPEVAAHMTRISTDLRDIRDRFGIIFPDVDYDIVGKADTAGAPPLRTVEDVCAFDRDRRDALEACVKRELWKIWKWLRV